MSEIKPALTPEEWAKVFAADGPVEYDSVFSDTTEWQQRYIGALALLGYFTWEMADALEALWLRMDDMGWGDLARPDDPSPHRLAMDAIRRMKALLPPREAS